VDEQAAMDDMVGGLDTVDARGEFNVDFAALAGRRWQSFAAVDATRIGPCHFDAVGRRKRPPLAAGRRATIKHSVSDASHAAGPRMAGTIGDAFWASDVEAEVGEIGPPECGFGHEDVG
jgi:hypothetical protein